MRCSNRPVTPATRWLGCARPRSSPDHFCVASCVAQNHAVTSTDIGLDPAELETCLRVLSQAEQLPVQHPDAVLVRRAVGGLFKAYKQARRVARRDEISSADRAVVAATATG